VNQQRDWQSVLYQNFYSEKQIRLIVRDNIRKFQNDIEVTEKDLKKFFLRLEIYLEEVQRIFGMCKEVARLQVQLEEQTQEQHQQYKALIVAPFRQN